MNKEVLDVIVIGGSYAGLSAAMALGRSLRNVLILDSGKPCNRQTPHSHNFLTQDGEAPETIAAVGREQVLKYQTVKFVSDTAVSGTKTNELFEIVTASGNIYTAKKLVFATGIKDHLPAIKGMAECWGITVIHCPYCHGYEFRGQRTAILANGQKGFHLATLVKNLTPDVTLFTRGNAEFDAEQKEKLEKKRIPVIEDDVTEIEHENGQVKNLVLTNGKKLFFDAVYADVPFTQHSNIPVELGCALNEQGYISVDQMHQTNVPGIYACGDNTAMMRSVATAVYTGNLTGAVVNRQLSGEEF
jgi:thioredoxin reductase